MLISDFDYELPEELIAQQPLAERDASRMLVLDRASGAWRDSSFRFFPTELQPDDLVVVNNSRVIPARIFGQRQESGGRVEIFLVRELGHKVWEALVKPGARLRRGAQVDLGDGRLKAEMLDDPGSEIRQVRFECEEPFETVLAQVGTTPLPPYIKRPAGLSTTDSERYQTIYSKPRGAIAAPTAGLHFTEEIHNELRERNQLIEITLHVGYGTFEPVRVEDVSEHKVSSERFEISTEAAVRINETKGKGGRIVAVGTTTTRALEAAYSPSAGVSAGHGETELTIRPGYKFQVVNALLTNFHLPRSSLLVLVSSFADRKLVLDSYRHAVKKHYRFYSYGDCMFIL